MNRFKQNLPFKYNAAVLLGMALALASNSLYATNWQYLGTYNSSTGAPGTLENLSSQLPADLVTKVKARLPEGKPLSDNSTFGVLTDDLGANISFKANAKVKVSYVTEGAGYQNSVGFFSFSSANLDTVALSEITDKIMFPNFSDNVLSFGKAVNLGEINSGQSIGFTIIANGWDSSNHRVKPDKSVYGIFRTIKRFNPESSSGNLNAHTVLFLDAEHSLLVLAFEDLNRQRASYNDYGYASDNDFNDVIIAIHVDPISAVITDKITPLVVPPITVTGENGPTNWREVTTPDVVVDTIKAAKKSNAGGNSDVAGNGQ